jgi:arginyl-tRNA synthetase
MLQRLTDDLKKAFQNEGIDPALAVVIPSSRPELSDFQCNGIRAHAGRAQVSAYELAQKIVKYLDDSFAEYSIAELGYINIRIKAPTLEKLVTAYLPKKIRQNKIIIDFGGPNVAKPMHVGHLRSLVIGDSLQRILRFAGYDVVSDIHFGDWGLQMGLLLASLEEIPLDHINIDLLEATYPVASAKIKKQKMSGDETPEELAAKNTLNEAATAFHTLAQSFTKKLQDGDPHCTIMWKRFIEVSMDEVQKELRRLDIAFTFYKGESDSQQFIPWLIARFEQYKASRESDGALIVPLGDDTPLLLQKADGAALYATTDLATIAERVANHAPDQIIYVTDNRQALHFKQVFEAARLVELAPPGTKLSHVPFGTINGPNGQPLKTRNGGTPKLGDLIQDALDEATKINPEAAHHVAMAALKFADLQNFRGSSYIFDPSKFTSFEGKTGPYLLYQAVRIKSILLKSATPTSFVISNDEEHALAVKLAFGFPMAIERAIEKLSPKEIADYAYDLAQAFSKFYANNQISTDGSRVVLSKIVLERLEDCLEMLGIQVPEKM